MKIKTSELIGPALRYAVASAQGYDPQVKVKDGRARITYSNPKPGTPCPAFDTDPAQAWPIIEQEDIFFSPLPDKGLRAFQFKDGQYLNLMDCWPHGKQITRLIVAMRCFVASKFGDEVDVSEELVS